MKNKFYITTSIAYTNDFPHIGFALELVQADVMSRYHRFLGDDVFFLTGTDEHGTKIAKAAQKAGKEPKDFVNEISAKYKALKTILNLSNNDFIRTTDSKRHWPVVKKVWLKLKKKGDIYKKKYKGFYCYGCEAFITEKNLVNGECPIHQKRAPELIEEENYFFRLSKYSKKLEKLIKIDELKIIPETRKNEVLGLIKQGLEDISFSRVKEKLKWGISVPDDPSQTIYVWMDALLNYISALGYENGEKFKKFWPADVHCVGKDILKFHALIWPGILLSLGLKFPKTIFAHGFITTGGQRISKSLGNIIDPFELVEKYGTDSVRYYLLSEIPSTEDGDFTYEKFEKRYNSDLASGIGNLVSRVRTMAEKTSFKGNFCSVKSKIKETKKNYKKSLKEFKFNEALKSIWDLISFCDRYIDKEKPWENKNQKSKKNEFPASESENQKVINNLLVILDNIADMIRPFLPETAEKILKETERDQKSGKLKNKKGKPLFPKIFQTEEC